MLSKALDAYIAYSFIKILSTPWEETKAYKLGIIDKNGVILKKMKDLKTSKERNAYTMIHRIIWNMKRLLDKLPPTQTRIGSFAAALWMLKENTEVNYGCSFEFAEKCLLEYISEHTGNSVLMESEENATDDDSPVLYKGVYRIKTGAIDGPGQTQTGDRIVVSRDIESEGMIAGWNIFLVKNARTGEFLYVSKDDLQEIEEFT